LHVRPPTSVYLLLRFLPAASVLAALVSFFSRVRGLRNAFPALLNSALVGFFAATKDHLLSRSPYEAALTFPVGRPRARYGVKVST